MQQPACHNLKCRHGVAGDHACQCTCQVHGGLPQLEHLRTGTAQSMFWAPRLQLDCALF